MGFFDIFKKKEPEKIDEPKLAPGETMLVPGIGRIPYPAYNGDEPYIFVSYSHKDSELVFAEIKLLNELGYNVWYDEGIAPGNEWTEEIANALEGCALFIVFFTPNSAESDNVQNEIDFVLDDKKPCIAVHLRETTLRGRTRLRLGMKQAIIKYTMLQEEYIYKLTSALERLGMKSKIDLRSVVSVPAIPTLPTVPVPPAPSTLPPSAEPAARKTTTFELTEQDRINIERIQNSEAIEIDFEWEDSAVKRYHGIKKRFTIPDRAVSIMSEAIQRFDFIEKVTLPHTVIELARHAFYDCPNLELVIIENPNVSIAEGGAFANCPKLSVRCHRNSVTHENLKKTFTGNIEFFEEDVAEQIPAQARNVHTWGDYVPKGTVYITLTDGTVIEAIANSLYCSADGWRMGSTASDNFYPGLDNPSKDLNYKQENLVPFSYTQSVTRQSDNTLAVLDYDDETTIIHPVERMSFLFLDGSDSRKCNSVNADDLQKLVFDRTKTPDFEVSYLNIVLKDGELSSPIAYFNFFFDISTMGIPYMKVTPDLTAAAGFPLPFRHMKKLTLTNLIKAPQMYSPFTEAELEAELKNGDICRFTVKRRFNLMALTGNGVLRTFGLHLLDRLEIT